MAFTEDMDPFFTDFGVTATPGSGAAITVIFDRAHIDAMGGQVSGTGPIALAKTTDVAAYVCGTTTLSIAGNTYTLRDMQPDGTGMTLLVLEDT